MTQDPGERTWEVEKVGSQFPRRALKKQLGTYYTFSHGSTTCTIGNIIVDSQKEDRPLQFHRLL